MAFECRLHTNYCMKMVYPHSIKILSNSPCISLCSLCHDSFLVLHFRISPLVARYHSPGFSYYSNYFVHNPAEALLIPPNAMSERSICNFTAFLCLAGDGQAAVQGGATRLVSWTRVWWCPLNLASVRLGRKGDYGSIARFCTL